MNRTLKSLASSAVCGAMLLSTGAQAFAQAPPPGPPSGYQQQQPPGPPPGYQQQQPPGPPPGYQGAPQQGTYQDPALQPPPGYSPEDAQRDASEAQRNADRGYAAAAEQWSSANCIRQEENRTAAGAIIGGVLGAVIGSNIAGGRSRGAGAVVGGTLGAVAGGAIANNSGPGCPPGFVLRPGAPAFYGPPGPAVVVYDQPGWYNPWLWYDGRWMYRPYPTIATGTTITVAKRP